MMHTNLHVLHMFDVYNEQMNCRLTRTLDVVWLEVLDEHQVFFLLPSHSRWYEDREDQHDSPELQQLFVLWETEVTLVVVHWLEENRIFHVASLESMVRERVATHPLNSFTLWMLHCQTLENPDLRS